MESHLQKTTLRDTTKCRAGGGLGVQNLRPQGKGFRFPQRLGKVPDQRRALSKVTSCRVNPLGLSVSAALCDAGGQDVCPATVPLEQGDALARPSSTLEDTGGDSNRNVYAKISGGLEQRIQY